MLELKFAYATNGQDIIEIDYFRKKSPSAIGPLVAVPTNTSTNFGPNSLQGGVAGVIIAPRTRPGTF